MLMNQPIPKRGRKYCIFDLMSSGNQPIPKRGRKPIGESKMYCATGTNPSPSGDENFPQDNITNITNKNQPIPKRGRKSEVSEICVCHNNFPLNQPIPKRGRKQELRKICFLWVFEPTHPHSGTKKAPAKIGRCFVL